MKNNNGNVESSSNIILLKTIEEFILLSFTEKEEYGWIISKRLQESLGKKFSFGTLYPTLDRLEAAGLLSSAWKITSEDGNKANKQNTPKKYYAITDKGREALANMKKYRAAIEEANQKVNTDQPSLVPIGAV